MRIIKYYNIVYLIFCITCFHLTSISQNNYEIGNYPIKNFSESDYNNAAAQNWAVVEDNRGVMYFGNNEGVLEFDGTTWRLFKLHNEGLVKALGIDKNGTIFVGGKGEFGFLQPNASGKMMYYCLNEQIPKNEKDYTTIWKIFTTNKGVYFQAKEKIFYYDYDTIKVILPETQFHLAFYAGKYFLVRQDDIGLSIIRNDSIIHLKGGEFFKDKRIYSVINFGTNFFLFFTKKDGIFTVSYQKLKHALNVVPYASSIKDYTKTYSLYNTIEINKNKYSIGTWGGGVLLIQSGNIKKIIDKNSGLADEIILNQYFDKRKDLWLVLSKGISKIGVNSPVTFFPDKVKGLNGTIQSIMRFDGKIYLATLLGVYYLDSENYFDNQTITLRKYSKFQYRFVPVKGLNEECWQLLNFKTQKEELLIIVKSKCLVEMNKQHKVDTILQEIPWCIHQSSLDKNRLYVGLENGVKSIYRKDGKWVDEGKIKGVDKTIENIEEENSGNLWLGTAYDGFIHVKLNLSDTNYFNNIEVTKYDTSSGLHDGPYFAMNFSNSVIFATGNGIYSFNDKENKFEINNNFDKRFNKNDRYIHLMSNDKKGRLWIVSFTNDGEKLDIGYISTKNTNGWRWISKPFKSIDDGGIQAIYIDDNITWYGGTKGLFRFDNNIAGDYNKKFNTIIRKVRVGEDSVIFWGTYFDKYGHTSLVQPDALKLKLKYAYNSIDFEFSAQNTEVEKPLKYSYYLQGYDKKWSDLSENTERYYTNLPEGEYVFMVKAVNIYNKESSIAKFEFIVLPPWYRTILAFIGYVLALIIFIYLIVTQYTKHLRAIIKERTKEIREQKEIVEEKNKHITDSIIYAKRIQNALLPPEQIIRKELPEHFILFKPRDIVSGDYYWFGRNDENIIIVAADCTGHGVPGAFMSMLGVAFLNEIINKNEVVKANEILNQLREHVITSLRQTGKEGEAKDGMDIAICVIDKKTKNLQFAGANNPLYLVRDRELIQVKADRMPIGIYIKTNPFTNNELSLQKNDCLYIFSDGYVDQFGGKSNRKFKSKPFKRLLVDINDKPMSEQRTILDDTIEDWKGINEQVDDILVIGMRI
ncbi:MAG: hypothetical protein DRJ01_07125 [Bacteroidetes bacterium]|nr:MAG: hypothetical protein DRJ01_07125 [Bacteroidota bacterium]